MVTYPEDWTPMQLKDLGYIQMCRRIFQSQTKTYGVIPFYKISTFGGKADAYISQELYERYKSLYPYPEKGDVLISAAGTVGKTIIFDGRDSYFQDSNIVWLKADRNAIDSKFLWWFYRSYPWAALEGTTIQRLYNSILLKTEIHLPEKPEQEEIAKTLSQFDTYIDNLAELIEKKRNIRDGALEDLISGRTRISGFDSSYTETELCQIADIQDGTHGTFHRTVLGHYLLSAKNIFNNRMIIGNDESRISERDYEKITANGFPQKGDILLSCVGTIGRCCLLKEDGIAFQRSVAFIRSKGIYRQYLLYVMQSHKTQEQIMRMVNASAQGGIYLGALKKLKLKITLNKHEQRAISAILAAMDEEIEALEIERNKMIQIREGAMDDLLTGRVRLPLREV